MDQFLATLDSLSRPGSDFALLFRNVLMGLLLLRLVRVRVVRRYPLLCAYLLFSILRATALHLAHYGTNEYAYVYLWTEPVLWLAYAAVCYEIYGLVFEKYTGLSILSRRTLVIVLAVASAVSFYAASRHMSHAWDVFPLLRNVGTYSRVVLGTMLLFLVAVLGFMLWFRMEVKRNIAVYTVAYSLLFVGVEMGHYLSASTGPLGTPAANFLMIASLDVVLTGWLLVFRRAGEFQSSHFGPVPNPMKEQELLAALEHLNQLAFTAAKKI